MHLIYEGVLQLLVIVPVRNMAALELSFICRVLCISLTLFFLQGDINTFSAMCSQIHVLAADMAPPINYGPSPHVLMDIFSRLPRCCCIASLSTNVFADIFLFTFHTLLVFQRVMQLCLHFCTCFAVSLPQWWFSHEGTAVLMDAFACIHPAGESF